MEPSNTFNIQTVNPTIIIDNGSSSLKYCLSNFDADGNMNIIRELPNIVGRPKYQSVMRQDRKECYIGHEAQQKRGVLSLNSPIEKGIITDFDDMEKVWHHVFYNELKIYPEEYPCVLSEASFGYKLNREKTTKTVFETFRIPSFTLQKQPVLSLIASGRATGLILDCGDGITQIVPIYEGYAMDYASIIRNISGCDLTQHLMDLMRMEGLIYYSSSEKQIIKQMKEECCYVALDPIEESNYYNFYHSKQYPFYLPDGNLIHVNKQRFQVPELLFKPIEIGNEILGLSETINKSIEKCDIDLRRDLAQNIVISGGTTQLPGFSQRIEKDMNRIAYYRKARVESSYNSKFSTAQGAYIVSQLSCFQPSFITMAEYDECGPSVIHRKCF